jgi:hypothetical protein
VGTKSVILKNVLLLSKKDILCGYEKRHNEKCLAFGILNRTFFERAKSKYQYMTTRSAVQKLSYFEDDLILRFKNSPVNDTYSHGC